MRVLRTSLRTGLGRWLFLMCARGVRRPSQLRKMLRTMSWVRWCRERGCHVDRSMYQNQLTEEVELQCRLCGFEAGHFWEQWHMREHANVQPHWIELERERAQ